MPASNNSRTGAGSGSGLGEGAAIVVDSGGADGCSVGSAGAGMTVTVEGTVGTWAGAVIVPGVAVPVVAVRDGALAGFAVVADGALLATGLLPVTGAGTGIATGRRAGETGAALWAGASLSSARMSTDT
jgi:hypothetical protein